MSSYAQSIVLTFKATAAIPKGSAVKAGANNTLVAVAAASTEKIIGIALNAALAAGDLVEVALGGGAAGLAGGTIAFGDLLTSDASGALIVTTTATHRIVGVAMDAAVVNDLVSVQVAISLI